VVRFCYFVAPCVACLLVLTALSSVASASAMPSYTVADELSNVRIADVFKVSLSDFAQKAEQGQQIEFTIDGNEISFHLKAGNPDYFKNGTQVYEGVDTKGVSLVRATMTSSWVHVSYSYLGNDFFIDPIDGTGESGYYAAYSAERIEDTTVDDGQDIVLPPPVSGDTSNLIPRDCTNGTASMDELTSPDLGCGIPGPEDELLTVASSQKSTPQSRESKDNKSCDGTGSDPEYRVLRMIMAADIEYRNRYPGDWSSRMYATMWDVSARYESQVGITIYPVMTHAIPSDECTTTNGPNLLGEFAEYMTTDPNVKDIARDVSHLFTGKNLAGNTLGVAYEVGVGGLRWVGSGFDWAYSLSEQFHDSFENLWLLGHELGHNLNGDHNYWSWIGVNRSWMYSSWGTSRTGQFSSTNAERIRSWAEQVLDTKRTINPGPSFVWDNLQTWSIQQEGSYIYWVGGYMTVDFYIKNVGTSDVYLDLLFVGARDASGANRDFGYQYGVTLSPGVNVHYGTSYVPQSGGTWTLWPAYQIGFRYGPYQWLTVQPTMYYDKGHWIGRDTTTSSDDVDLFYRFHVLSTTPTLTVGSSVIVDVTMFNGKPGRSTNTFDFFFIGCRWSSLHGVNKDFGWTGATTLTQCADVSVGTGTGCHLFVSRTIDYSGNWYFWPAYNYQGSYGPYAWHYLTLCIS
jgi:hypothetical protein